MSLGVRGDLDHQYETSSVNGYEVPFLSVLSDVFSGNCFLPVRRLPRGRSAVIRGPEYMVTTRLPILCLPLTPPRDPHTPCSKMQPLGLIMEKRVTLCLLEVTRPISHERKLKEPKSARAATPPSRNDQ